MLSKMLPRRLGAYEAWRFHENLEDERIRFFDPMHPPFSIVPESFRMEFSRPVKYESIIEAVRIFCEECVPTSKSSQTANGISIFLRGRSLGSGREARRVSMR
jgi:hypothetical protein